jgi:hypothetical protein
VGDLEDPFKLSKMVIGIYSYSQFQFHKKRHKPEVENRFRKSAKLSDGHIRSLLLKVNNGNLLRTVNN